MYLTSHSRIATPAYPSSFFAFPVSVFSLITPLLPHFLPLVHPKNQRGPQGHSSMGKGGEGGHFPGGEGRGEKASRHSSQEGRAGRGRREPERMRGHCHKLDLPNYGCKQAPHTTALTTRHTQKNSSASSHKRRVSPSLSSRARL